VGAHGLGGLDLDLAGEQARQEEVASAAEVFNLTLKRLNLRKDWLCITVERFQNVP